MAVYDDEKQGQSGTHTTPTDEELRQLTGITPDEEGAMDREAHSGAAADTAERKGLFNKGGDGDGDEDAEYGPSALDSMKDRLGKGYRNDDQERKNWISRGLRSNSKLKKRLAIAGAAAGGSAIAGIIAFMALLPLKIEHFISNLENYSSAASKTALQTEGNHLFKDYIRKYVIQNLGKPGCRSTASAGCVAPIGGNNPVSRLYQAWKQDRIESKLATKFGLEIGKTGSTGKYYIRTANERFDFKDKESLSAFFQDDHTRSGKLYEIEQEIADRLKTASYWDRIYYRFKVAPLLKAKYGIRYCLNACKVLHKKADNFKEWRQTAKAVTLQRVLEPLSESQGFIVSCIMAGSGDCDFNKLRDANPGDTTRETEGSSKFHENLVRLASKFTDEELQDLVKRSEQVSKDGLSKYVVRQTATKLAVSLGADGAKAGAGAAKAVDPITWVLLAAQLSKIATEIGPVIKYASYAATAAASAQLWTEYQTTAAEMKSGNMDAEQIGSFANALDSSLDTSDISSINSASQKLKLDGSDVTASSATETPLYQATLGSNGVSTNAASVFSGTAFADGTSSTGYAQNGCEGDPVPSGDLVCPIEDFGSPKATASIINGISSIGTKSRTIYPPIRLAFAILDAINKFVDWVLGKALAPVISSIASKFNAVCKITPGCGSMVDGLKGVVGKIFDLILGVFAKQPLNDLSGGRMFDMLFAGAQVSFNTACQATLGCAFIKNETAANIQSDYLRQQQTQFNQQPIFARMFDTSSPYSLVSRLAISMPSSPSLMANSLFSTITSPFSSLGNMSASLLTGTSAHAAISNAKIAGAFGIPNTGYLPSQIPKHPQEFFDANCVNGPEGKMVDGKLDISEWLNDDAHVMLDKDTHEVVFKVPNRCLLINSSVQTFGGMFDSSLLPEDSLNEDLQGTTEGGSTFRIASYNVLGASHTAPGGNSKLPPWNERIPKVVENIQAKNIDIIGFQELEPDQRSYVESHLSDYERTTWGKEADSIMWRTSCSSDTDCTSFTKVDQGTWKSNYFGGTTQEPWVKLRDNSTGQELYVMNVHDPIDKGEGNAKIRYENALKHLDLIQKLHKNAPVVFTGDFNNGYTKSDGAGMPSDQKTAYCVLISSGLMHDAYDASSGRKEKCPNPLPAGSGIDTKIDHIYVSTGLEVGDYFDINKPQSGSDHVPVIGEVTIPSTSDGGNDMRVASFNIYYANAKKGCCSTAYSRDWPMRLGRSASVIKSNHFDVVGLQEVRQEQWAAIQQNKYLGGQYDIFPTRYSSYAAQNPIIWRKDRFSLVEGKVIPGYTVLGRYSPVANVQVKLRNSQTGQEFYLINMHEPVHAGNAERRTISAKNRWEYVNNLSREGLPIFLTGDFNSSYSIVTDASRNTTWQGKKANLPYCILTARNVLWDSFDASRHRSGTCRSFNAKDAPGGVDHIYMSTAVSASGYNYSIAAPGNGSDVHNTLFVDVSIKGSSAN